MSRQHRKLNFYKDADGEWRWRVKAHNGSILAVSSEAYKELRACLKAYLSIAWISNESIETELAMHGYRIEKWGDVNGSPVLKRIHPDELGKV